jgi:hypothetical protein
MDYLKELFVVSEIIEELVKKHYICYYPVKKYTTYAR